MFITRLDGGGGIRIRSSRWLLTSTVRSNEHEHGAEPQIWSRLGRGVRDEAIRRGTVDGGPTADDPVSTRPSGQGKALAGDKVTRYVRMLEVHAGSTTHL